MPAQAPCSNDEPSPPGAPDQGRLLGNPDREHRNPSVPARSQVVEDVAFVERQIAEIEGDLTAAVGAYQQAFDEAPGSTLVRRANPRMRTSPGCEVSVIFT